MNTAVAVAPDGDLTLFAARPRDQPFPGRLLIRSSRLYKNKGTTIMIELLMKPEVGKGRGGEPRVFVTTCWSVILSAADSQSAEQKARDALAQLCRTYWRPIFSFVCRRGYSTEDAQDLTQDFLLTILKKNWVHQVDRNRGRFRSLLLKSLQNFLINAAEKTHARKRGGGVDFISWD